MVNGFRYYRALESVSIASALSTAFTIYPCQIRVHQRWQSKLQLPIARKKEWRPATAGSSPHAVTCQHCDTHYFSIGLEPATFRSLVDCWSDALPVVAPTHQHIRISGWNLRSPQNLKGTGKNFVILTSTVFDWSMMRVTDGRLACYSSLSLV